MSLLPAALFFFPSSISALYTVRSHLSINHSSFMTQYMSRAYCIHAIGGKHLSRARRKTIQQQSHQILGCSTTGSCNHCRVVFKFHSLRHHIFLEHFARTRRYSDLCPNQCRWLNEPDRTLGKSRQIKPEVGTLWGWYFTKMAHASELRVHNRSSKAKRSL